MHTSSELENRLPLPQQDCMNNAGCPRLGERVASRIRTRPSIAIRQPTGTGAAKASSATSTCDRERLEARRQGRSRARQR
jgi:hypothetical protein